jgi:hypothetical protein
VFLGGSSSLAISPALPRTSHLVSSYDNHMKPFFLIIFTLSSKAYFTHTKSNIILMSVTKGKFPILLQNLTQTYANFYLFLLDLKGNSRCRSNMTNNLLNRVIVPCIVLKQTLRISTCTKDSVDAAG